MHGYGNEMREGSLIKNKVICSIHNKKMEYRTYTDFEWIFFSFVIRYLQ